MKHVERIVPANFNLFFFGDVHIGTLLHDEDGFDEFIERLNSPYEGVKHNIAIGMGDYIEAIDHSDKRFDVHSVDLGKIRPDQQMDHFISKIRSSKKKIVTALFGNHEGKLLKYYDYVRSACHQLNIPYGTYSAVVTFRRKNQDNHLFKVFATHGNGSISSVADDPLRITANLKLSLKRKFKNKFADCVIQAMGHTHKLLIARPKRLLYLTSDGNKIQQHYTDSLQDAEYIHADHRYFLNTGSFVRLYREGVSGYAERAMFDPMEIGFVVVRIRDCKVVGADKIYV